MKFFSFFLMIALAFTFSCKEKNIEISEMKGEQLLVNDTLEENPEIKAFIKPYAEHVAQEMDSVLAYTPKTLSKTDTQYNTAIGNMMADAVFEMANPVFKNRTQHNLDGVLLNFGGIRSIISQGKITTKTAYDIMPFENEVVVTKLSAEAMQELFNYLVKNQIAHPIAGLELSLASNGSIAKALVQGKPIDTAKTYYIATSDYLQQGGDHMTFFKKTDTIFPLDYKLRNLFIDYFKKKDTIAPTSDNRFVNPNES